jgi:endonuclease YncB( thermonuclease family)
MAAIDVSGNGQRTGRMRLGARSGTDLVEVNVHDGDTVGAQAVGNFGVRFLGVDTPEVSFQLPGRGFVSLTDPAWATYLKDPFAAEHGSYPIDPELRAALLPRLGTGAAANHAGYAAAAREFLVGEIKDDVAAMGTTPEEFQLHLSFADEVLDTYGRLLCYLNRRQPDPNLPSRRPRSYNERLLAAGLALPYFIWPNVEPFRAPRPLLASVPTPRQLPALAEEGALGAARRAVQAARAARLGVYDDVDPLRLEPFELRFLGRREMPSRWLVDLSGASGDVLLPPESYPRVPAGENRLFVGEEHVPLFELRGWRAGRALSVPAGLPSQPTVAAPVAV